MGTLFSCGGLVVKCWDPCRPRKPEGRAIGGTSRKPEIRLTALLCDYRLLEARA